MEQISKEHRRPAGKVQERVLVGLQFVVFLVAVKFRVGGGKEGAGELLPGEHGGVFILQGDVYKRQDFPVRSKAPSCSERAAVSTAAAVSPLPAAVVSRLVFSTSASARQAAR